MNHGLDPAPGAGRSVAGAEEERLLTTGEFARRGLLSPKALRLYDRQGLLPPDRIDPDSGYRYYRPERLATARLIVRLRGLDMPLAVVAEVLALPGPAAAERVAAYWAAVERRTASQRTLADHLRVQLSGLEGIDEMYRIEQRDVPEQLVLTEQRRAKPEELDRFIPEATARLEAVAAAHGGVAAAPFVVYHGDVNEDADGPVEVCVPVDPARAGELTAAGPTAAHRTEPAHREAYTTITKAQVEYPQILSAYDAVCAWMERTGTPRTGPGREVYFADWATAEPSDQVCDIAFPISG
ncbi:MerR family transcriptional regulator [Kitasatospora phosalacinea]|uniref:MerR family transcriptional regulator n=1 Tax=Kitasatospora phosalacinea TaxID=2065 RepID=A0A9W6PFC0_9ACTN|nr:MerR family transcriptional regulator [Kitasatospora phosalacinea]GLW54040.1 MerR family transcriptional regulator [Kitasatospora phosalacinea]